jgi:thiamine-phosphate pyrophosphorylase
MKLNKENLLLYAVTDRSWLGDHTLSWQVEQAILGGATFIQLREKDMPFDEFVKEATEIKKITDQYKVPFFINDNVEVALAVDADGVHIGQSDDAIELARRKLGQDKIIGLSAHTIREAIQAQKNGADYIGTGAVFNTSTKLDANTVSFETLQDICRAVSIPVVAIGGISKENMAFLASSGIDGIAVVSAIFAQEDIKQATRELLLELNKLHLINV